jgi:hypothetical protein
MPADLPSLRDYLEPLRRHLPPALVSAAGFAAMEPSAALMPARFGHSPFGFEVRLEAGPLGADLLAFANPATGDLEALAEHPIPSELRTTPAWQALDRLTTASAGGEPLAGKLENLWLELDTTGEAPLLPSLFFMPVAMLRPGRQDHTAALAITEAALEVVAAETPACLASGSLRRCFAPLPPAASIFQVGVMNARPSRYVRICVTLHNQRTALAYLEAVGFPGDLAAVHRRLAWLRRYTNRLRFNLDLAEDVAPKLGIECYLGGPGPERHWRDFLAALCREGACDPAKAAALLAYIGESRPEDEPGTWPPTFTAAAAWLGRGNRPVLIRSLHHVKVVLAPGRDLEAKAYLGAEYRWH